MKKNLIILSIILFNLFSCSKDEELIIIKQWHLSPSKITLDVEKSKSLPQHLNQKDIYLRVEALLKERDDRVIISEGCEGEIDDSFTTKFNGWDLKALKTKILDSNYSDILAPVGMKIKAKYPDIKVICGDNKALMKKHLLAFSDARGFSGFYTRLKSYENTDTRKFGMYAKQLESLFPEQKIEDPLKFTLDKSIKAVRSLSEYINKRNEVFFEKIQSNMDRSPILIIGGLHIQDLEKRVNAKKIKYKTISPRGYENNEVELLKKLENSLLTESQMKLVLFQLPSKFDIKTFPFKKNQMKNIASITELKELKYIAKEVGLPFEVLLSDYDGDGIRDFTLSQSKQRVILMAEDKDWDNDGKLNLVDGSIGSHVLVNFGNKAIYQNTYRSRGQLGESLKTIKQNRIEVIYNEKQELLVLTIFAKILPLVKSFKKKLRFISASKRDVNYGKNSFFSYVKSHENLEYYPEQLKAYFEKEYNKRFKGVKYDKFVSQYVVPVIVHSLLHEVGHALDEFDPEKLARLNHWSWNKDPVKSTYLVAGREEVNKISFVKKDVLFMKKSFKSWSEEYISFHSYLGDKLKEFKDLSRFVKAVENSKFFFKHIGMSSRELSLSFLNKYEIPSLYALSKPSEWFAESFAACMFQKVYKDSAQKHRSVTYEHLIGFSPRGVSSSLCESFK